MAKCKCLSSYTAPAYIWAILSIIAAIICPFGLYFSNWLEREGSIISTQTNTSITVWSSVSSFRVCLNETNRISIGCSSYLMFSDMYSREWQAVTLMMGIGSCFLVLVALTSLFGFFVRKLFNLVVVILTFSFQALGAILFVISIIVFPAGMGVNPVQELCGPESGKFRLGDCSLGWAFILIIIGTLLALVAMVMSWTALKWRDKEDHDSFSI